MCRRRDLSASGEGFELSRRPRFVTAEYMCDNLGSVSITPCVDIGGGVRKFVLHEENAANKENDRMRTRLNAQHFQTTTLTYASAFIFAWTLSA